MGAKSRGNYPIGMYVSQEDWDAMFPKEKKKDESETGRSVTSPDNDQLIPGTTEERVPEVQTGKNSNE